MRVEPFRLVRLGLGFVVILGCAAAFWGLGTNSLALDELFTAYFADPDQASLSAMLRRAAEDVHPPGYYLLVYLAAQLGGDFAVVARATSAFFSVLALLILYHALPQPVGRLGRLFACAFAATSEVWYYLSQEARSYSLAFVFAGAFLGLGLRIQRAVRKRETPASLIIAFGVVGALGGLTHFYLLFLAAGVLATLILFAVDWNQRFALAACGLGVALPALAFMAWQDAYRAVDLSDTWFSNTPGFVFHHTMLGLRALLGTELALGFIVFVMAGYIFSVSRHNREGEHRNEISWMFRLVILSPLIAIILSIVVSIVAMPNFSFRLFNIIAPFMWAFFGLIAHEIARERRHSWILLCCVVYLVGMSTTQAIWRSDPYKEEWRNSAHFVQSQRACQDKRIPVVVFDKDYITKSFSRFFYGFYIDRRNEFVFHEIKKGSVKEELIEVPVLDVVQGRIYGKDDCPILLWSVFFFDKREIRSVGNEMARQFDIPEGKMIQIMDFPANDEKHFPFDVIFPEGPAKAFVVLVGDQ